MAEREGEEGEAEEAEEEDTHGGRSVANGSKQKPAGRIAIKIHDQSRRKDLPAAMGF